MIDPNIPILLIDDHTIVLEGCVILLKQHGFKNIHVASNCEEGLQFLIKTQPMLAIIDISMPGMGGLGIVRRIQKKQLRTKVIVFSMHDDPSIVSRTLNAGVNGYISKTNSPESLIDAVKSVLAGNIYLSQDIAQILALDKLNPTRSRLDSLTPKEYEIFEMLVNGNDISEIALTLYLSSKSVSNYVTKIKTKLEVSSVADMVHLGYKYNVTQPDLQMSE